MAEAMPQTKAMLFAVSSPHPSLSLDQFNNWYDVRHAPSRAACPGVHSVCRFHAEDEKGTWTWLAIYELADENALKSDEYRRAREEDGDDESKMFDFLSRRVYHLLSDKSRDDYSSFAASGKARHMSVVSLQPDPSSNLTHQEFDEWYEQEHISMLSKCPGWLRSSRWQLVDARDPRDWDVKQKGIASFLALHEWEDVNVVRASAEYDAATSTEWRNRMIGQIDHATEERRVLKLWRQF